MERSYRKCSEPGCFGPTIAHDDSGLCMGHKIGSGISLYEAKMRLDNNWREKLGVEPGMSKEETLSKFPGWRVTKKTCERCEEKDLSEFCPLHLICEEADRKEMEEDARRQSIHGKNGYGEARFEEEGFNYHEEERFEVGGDL
jgi:hypothetical protein